MVERRGGGGEVEVERWCSGGEERWRWRGGVVV